MNVQIKTLNTYGSIKVQCIQFHKQKGGNWISCSEPQYNIWFSESYLKEKFQRELRHGPGPLILHQSTFGIEEFFYLDYVHVNQTAATSQCLSSKEKMEHSQDQESSVLPRTTEIVHVKFYSLNPTTSTQHFTKMEIPTYCMQQIQ